MNSKSLRARASGASVDEEAAIGKRCDARARYETPVAELPVTDPIRYDSTPGRA